MSAASKGRENSFVRFSLLLNRQSIPMLKGEESIMSLSKCLSVLVTLFCFYSALNIFCAP